jgi:hypothetical protein
LKISHFFSWGSCSHPGFNHWHCRVQGPRDTCGCWALDQGQSRVRTLHTEYTPDFEDLAKQYMKKCKHITDTLLYWSYTEMIFLLTELNSFIKLVSLISFSFFNVATRKFEITYRTHRVFLLVLNQIYTVQYDNCISLVK